MGLRNFCQEINDNSMIDSRFIKHSFLPFPEIGRLGLACPVSHMAPSLLREIQMVACSVLEQLTSKQIHFLKLKEHDSIHFSLKLCGNDIFI